MLEHDVLVIGAGLAGMRAAIAARASGASAAIISKVHPVRSHSNAAQGGINAALTDRGDDWEDHAYDTVKGSDFLGDQDAIEVMCQSAGKALIDMEHMGVTFNRDDEGYLGVSPNCRCREGYRNRPGVPGIELTRRVQHLSPIHI